MPTLEDLRYFQSLPLDIKVAMTQTRLREWVNHFGENGVYSVTAYRKADIS